MLRISPSGQLFVAGQQQDMIALSLFALYACSRGV